MIKTTVAALLASLAIGPSLGLAADLRPDDNAPLPRGSSDTYIVTLTANGQFQPSFPGSDKLTGMVYPAISL